MIVVLRDTNQISVRLFLYLFERNPMAETIENKNEEFSMQTLQQTAAAEVKQEPETSQRVELNSLAMLRTHDSDEQMAEHMKRNLEHSHRQKVDLSEELDRQRVVGHSLGQSLAQETINIPEQNKPQPKLTPATAPASPAPRPHM